MCSSLCLFINVYTYIMKFLNFNFTSVAKKLNQFDTSFNFESIIQENITNLQLTYLCTKLKLLNKQLNSLSIYAKKKRSYLTLMSTFGCLYKSLFLDLRPSFTQATLSSRLDFLYNLNLIQQMNNAIYTYSWCTSIASPFFHLEYKNNKYTLIYLKKAKREFLVLKWLSFFLKLSKSSYKNSLNFVFYDFLVGFKQSKAYLQKKKIVYIIF